MKIHIKDLPSQSKHLTVVLVVSKLFPLSYLIHTELNFCGFG